jgi:hypothetical protein
MERGRREEEKKKRTNRETNQVEDARPQGSNEGNIRRREKKRGEKETIWVKRSYHATRCTTLRGQS